MERLERARHHIYLRCRHVPLLADSTVLPATLAPAALRHIALERHTLAVTPRLAPPD
jgi:hypothetical protein